MQNEKSVNRLGQVKRNPSRDNKNINQGQNYEKERVDNKSIENGNAETNQAQFAGNESPLDSSGISDTAGSDNANQRSGKTKQKAAGKNAGDEQTGSQALQNSHGAQGPDSQSGESAGSVKYDANEQFDDDEDFGSSTRQ